MDKCVMEQQILRYVGQDDKVTVELAWSLTPAGPTVRAPLVWESFGHNAKIHTEIPYRLLTVAPLNSVTSDKVY